MFGSSQWMYSSGAASFYDTEIDGSLRFNNDDSASVTKSFTTTETSSKIKTISFWMKRGQVQLQQDILGANSASENGDTRTIVYFDSSDRLNVQSRLNQAGDTATTTAQYRDPSAWYHFVLAFNTTLAAQDDRLKLYVNGVLTSTLYYNSRISQNRDIHFGNSISGSTSKIGTVQTTGFPFFDGYIADFYLVDGQQLTADSFGETKSGVWIPKAYSGSYGTNGFHLEFAGNANDSSGNGNNFTANNISSYDYVPDSPTLNFCTLNPLDTNVTLAQGNLHAVDIGNYNDAPATFGMTSGKWYFEGYNKDSQASLIGITGLSNSGKDHSAVDSLRTVYEDNGVIYREGTGLSNTSVSTYGTNDIIGVALDADAGTIAFYKNGSLVNSTTNSVYANNDWKFYVGVGGGADWIVNFGQDSTFAGNTTAGGNSDANGYGDFKHSVPTDYLALCTANLTVAEGVDPLEDNSPQDHFSVVLHTGTGSNKTVSGVGFQPDLVYNMHRSTASENMMADAVRGANKAINTRANYTEDTATNLITGFTSDGFSLGNDVAVNTNGASIVTWCWKANGSGVSNTDGSVTATVSANQDAGFSIATWTTTSSNHTVGHGLGATPEMIIAKARNASYNWDVYHKVATPGGSNRLILNSGGGAFSTDDPYANVAPDSNDFTFSGSFYGGGKTVVAYSFRSIDGYCKVGSYVGNSSTPNFVYLGFKPALILFIGSYDWNLIDPYRMYNGQGSGHFLFANRSSAESGDEPIDILSNGFALRYSGTSGSNNPGTTHYYIAWAENPFKYGTAV